MITGSQLLEDLALVANVKSISGLTEASGDDEKTEKTAVQGVKQGMRREKEREMFHKRKGRDINLTNYNEDEDLNLEDFEGLELETGAPTGGFEDLTAEHFGESDDDDIDEAELHERVPSSQWKSSDPLTGGYPPFRDKNGMVTKSKRKARTWFNSKTGKLHRVKNGKINPRPITKTCGRNARDLSNPKDVRCYDGKNMDKQEEFEIQHGGPTGGFETLNMDFFGEGLELHREAYRQRLEALEESKKKPE